MKPTDNLFADFAPVSAAQWKARIIEDLKGADYDKKVVWKTDEGFSVEPFYNAASLADQDRYQPPLQRVRNWINYVEIKADSAEEANAQAVKMKKQGASGLLFKIGDVDIIDFNTLLKNIDPRTTVVSFSLEKPFYYFLPSWFDYLLEKGLSRADIQGFVELDILDTWSVTGDTEGFNTLAEWIKGAKAYPQFRRLVIRSHAFVNAGSNIIQELAFTLNKLTDYIDQLTAAGCSLKDIINNTVLHLAIGGDYFFEIAKLRAIRILLDIILSAYDLENENIPLFCSNAYWSKSLYDPNVNMLRNTSEAMSAILGGCDALLTCPHDAGIRPPTDFSTRIALNISTICREEAYFDKVVDPASGSYYIEHITGQLVTHALQLFKEVEAKGGYIKAFTNGFIQQQIALVRDKKEKELVARKRVYVGTNKYPNETEKAVLKEEANTFTHAHSLSLLAPQRATRLFDQLRSRTLRYFEKTGYLPGVYLACFGNLAMRKARATFSGEFFGTAGFNILGEFFFNDVKEAATAAAQSQADIVVICSSDPDYETGAAEFARTFKSIAAQKTLVLAGYPEAMIDNLQQAGVDSFIHIRSNTIEVLTAFQNKLLS